jgi:hypothetical protein
MRQTQSGIAREGRRVNPAAHGRERQALINVAATGLPATPTYVFSAKGATFTVSLGRRPRRHGKKTPALKARFTSETGFFGLNTPSPGLKRAFSARLQAPQLDPGALPQARNM